MLQNVANVVSKVNRTNVKKIVVEIAVNVTLVAFQKNQKVLDQCAVSVPFSFSTNYHLGNLYVYMDQWHSFAVKNLEWVKDIIRL